MAPENAQACRELNAMALKHGDRQTREWVLLRMLDRTWPQDSSVWDEARAGLAGLVKEHNDAGKVEEARELLLKQERADSSDLEIVMRWDTDKTDIDLHVKEPAQTVNYNSRTSWQGGSLDRDLTTGFGPETYTLRRAPAGKYSVSIHHYNGTLPTMVELDITHRKGRGNERRERRSLQLVKPKQWIEVLTIDLNSRE